MDDDAARRLAGNEAYFRKVNEAIERGQWPGEESAPVGFRCECARMGCNKLVLLTLGQYEQVRAHPQRFIVLAGHEVPELETVVDVAEEYVVVQKVGAAAGVARATDPRD
jgi:hypothetical protein